MQRVISEVSAHIGPFTVMATSLGTGLVAGAAFTNIASIAARVLVSEKEAAVLSIGVGLFLAPIAIGAVTYLTFTLIIEILPNALSRSSYRQIPSIFWTVGFAQTLLTISAAQRLIFGSFVPRSILELVAMVAVSVAVGTLYTKLDNEWLRNALVRQTPEEIRTTVQEVDKEQLLLHFPVRDRFFSPTMPRENIHAFIEAFLLREDISRDNIVGIFHKLLGYNLDSDLLRLQTLMKNRLLFFLRLHETALNDPQFQHFFIKWCRDEDLCYALTQASTEATTTFLKTEIARRRLKEEDIARHQAEFLCFFNAWHPNDRLHFSEDALKWLSIMFLEDDKSIIWVAWALSQKELPQDVPDFVKSSVRVYPQNYGRLIGLWNRSQLGGFKNLNALRDRFELDDKAKQELNKALDRSVFDAYSDKLLYDTSVSMNDHMGDAFQAKLAPLMLPPNWHFDYPTKDAEAGALDRLPNAVIFSILLPKLHPADAALLSRTCRKMFSMIYSPQNKAPMRAYGHLFKLSRFIEQNRDTLSQRFLQALAKAWPPDLWPPDSTVARTWMTL